MNKLARNIGIFVILVFIIWIMWGLFFRESPNGPIVSSIDAIQAVQAKYDEVATIEMVLTPAPFKSQLIVVYEKQYGWEIVFYQGSGDCPSGCINNYFWYFSVYRDGNITKAGEYSRVFRPDKNDYQETGSPLWGYPK